MIQIIQLWVHCSTLYIKSCKLSLVILIYPFVLQIFVGGLDQNVTDDVLHQVFSAYGELVHVKIPVGKRCGFVQFANRSVVSLNLKGVLNIFIPHSNHHLWGYTAILQYMDYFVSVSTNFILSSFDSFQELMPRRLQTSSMALCQAIKTFGFHGVVVRINRLGLAFH